MTLATHAVVGAGLAVVAPMPAAVAFGLGFASHFVLDAIPHWDYPLGSHHEDPTDAARHTFTLGPAFVFDLVKIALDVALGALLAWWLFAGAAPGLVLFAGAAGAILPDALQFVQARLGGRLLNGLQRFHIWLHATYRLDGRHVVGPLIQLVLIALWGWFILSL